MTPIQDRKDNFSTPNPRLGKVLIQNPADGTDGIRASNTQEASSALLADRFFVLISNTLSSALLVQTLQNGGNE